MGDPTAREEIHREAQGVLIRRQVIDMPREEGVEDFLTKLVALTSSSNGKCVDNPGTQNCDREQETK